MAAALIIGETWRSSRKEGKRRDGVDDKLEELGTQVVELTTRVETLSTTMEESLRVEQQRYVA